MYLSQNIISKVLKVSDKAEDEAAASYLHPVYPGISGKLFSTRSDSCLKCMLSNIFKQNVLHGNYFLNSYKLAIG